MFSSVFATMTGIPTRARERAVPGFHFASICVHERKDSYAHLIYHRAPLFSLGPVVVASATMLKIQKVVHGKFATERKTLRSRAPVFVALLLSWALGAVCLHSYMYHTTCVSRTLHIRANEAPAPRCCLCVR